LAVFLFSKSFAGKGTSCSIAKRFFCGPVIVSTIGPIMSYSPLGSGSAHEAMILFLEANHSALAAAISGFFSRACWIRSVSLSNGEGNGSSWA